ncbi:hypothetical protein GOB86_15120 [Acetobacter lambici]|nr:hypothetical protein [Acetobacter lambici]
MPQLIRIGMDTSKKVFQLHGVNAGITTRKCILRTLGVNTCRTGHIDADFFCGCRPLCKSFLTHIDV